jgi:peptidoglycan LD-endopeptidase LytH
MRTVVALLVALAVGACGGPPRAQDPEPTAPTAVPSPTEQAAQPPAATSAYAFPVAGCTVHYGHDHHDYPATDIFTRVGCAFVSPVAGVVDEVTTDDRWDSESNRGADRGGRSVSVRGTDGVRYYGSHLSAVASGIGPGVRVRPGQLLGRVGRAGSAKGTPSHLHFGISWPTRPGVWWVRRGVVWPWPYLDAWRAGTRRSPAAEVAEARTAAGTDVPTCQADC